MLLADFERFLHLQVTEAVNQKHKRSTFFRHLSKVPLFYIVSRAKIQTQLSTVLRYLSKFRSFIGFRAWCTS
jgi:hypothetical protein